MRRSKRARPPASLIALICAGGFLVPSGVLAQDPAPADPAPADPAPAPAPATAETPAPAPAACVPACREGFLCHEGSCISACNPACPDGQVCTADAQCVPAAQPEGAAVNVAVTGVCVSDNQCRHPRRCEAGKCTITEGYLDQLGAEARARTVAGAIVMGIGGLIMLSSAIAFGSGVSAKNDGNSDDDQFIAGYSLLGIGGLTVIAGSIPLGVGQNKKRRWKVLSAEQQAPGSE